MNIEELFTLSGTGLVIGALLSWLSLAFTARRVPASAAQTQPNSRQPLSSGGKALRVFSLAAALLALIGLGWGLLDRWRWYMWQMNTDWFLSFPTATFYESAVFCAFLTALASAACSSVRRSPQLFGGGIMLSGIVLLALNLYAVPTAPVLFLPALQSYWLVAHVTLSFTTYALFGLSACAGAALLCGNSCTAHPPSEPPRTRNLHDRGPFLRFNLGASLLGTLLGVGSQRDLGIYHLVRLPRYSSF